MTKLDDLRALAERSELTRLSTDYLPEDDPEGIQLGGWRIHDFPDKPNPHGIWFAHYICSGLDEDQAKMIVTSFNLVRKLLSEEGERLMARAMFDMEWAKLGPTESEWVSSKPYWIDHARAAINALIEASDV